MKSMLLNKKIIELKNEVKNIKSDNNDLRQELLLLKIDKNLDKHQSDNEQNEHKDGDEFSQQALLFDKGIVDDSQLNLVNKMLPPKWFLKVKIVVSHDYCRVSIGGVPFTVDVGEPKPNRPNTMNLVEK